MTYFSEVPPDTRVHGAAMAVGALFFVCFVLLVVYVVIPFIAKTLSDKDQAQRDASDPLVSGARASTQPLAARDADTGLMEGYECVRCSDSGAGDGLPRPVVPPVLATCAQSAATAWGRPDKWMFASAQARQAAGNYITSAPAGLSGIEACVKACRDGDYEALPGLGEQPVCRAATYDASQRMCHFFFACDAVRPRSAATTHLALDSGVTPEVLGGEDDGADPGPPKPNPRG